MYLSCKCVFFQTKCLLSNTFEAKMNLFCKIHWTMELSQMSQDTCDITKNTIPLLKINIILASHIYRQISDWWPQTWHCYFFFVSLVVVVFGSYFQENIEWKKNRDKWWMAWPYDCCDNVIRFMRMKNVICENLWTRNCLVKYIVSWCSL